MPQESLPQDGPTNERRPLKFKGLNAEGQTAHGDSYRRRENSYTLLRNRTGFDLAGARAKEEGRARAFAFRVNVSGGGHLALTFFDELSLWRQSLEVLSCLPAWPILLRSL
jgi:hypothetical protein